MVNSLGNLVTATAARAAGVFSLLNYLCTEDNGGSNLDGSCRAVIFMCRVVIVAASAGSVALKYARIALASEKNDLFVDGGNALKLLISAANASFKSEIYKETDINGVKATVKLNRVNGYAGICYFCAFYTHVSCMFDNFLSEIGKIDLYVLIAITVTARVEHTVSFYANSFS